MCALLDWLVPKRNNAVFLASVHGDKYAGNSRYLFEYMAKEHPELDARFYLKAPVKDGPVNKVMYPGVKTFWFYLRAQTLFVTHGCSDFFPYAPSLRKTVVQLWHGIPLRYTSTLSPLRTQAVRDRLKKQSQRYDYTVAPSVEAAFRHCCCNQTDMRSVRYCGQPRNDQLVANKRNPLPEDAQRALEGADKVILYAPTSRWYGKTPWFALEDFDRAELDAVLEKHNAVLLLRPHHSDVGSVQHLLSGRLRNFSTAVCPDLNDAMPYADVLIADYSSLIYDYLLLDRPIIFLHHDYEEYDNFFHFLFDEPDFWFPGPRPVTGTEFTSVLDDLLSGKDLWRERRKLVNRLINTKQTACSGAQIVEALGLGRV